jgi:hypothetical protein
VPTKFSQSANKVQPKCQQSSAKVPTKFSQSANSVQQKRQQSSAKVPTKFNGVFLMRFHPMA